MPESPRSPSMPNTEGTRHDQAQGGDGAVAAAWADREGRLASDEARLRAGPVEHVASMTSYHQGQPTVQVQQATHGQAAPRVPDVGGHGSASGPIG